MAQTCMQCCQSRKLIVAPSITDENGYDLISGRPTMREIRRRNPHYRHDNQSWKASTAAPKQYRRHGKRTS